MPTMAIVAAAIVAHLLGEEVSSAGLHNCCDNPCFKGVLLSHFIVRAKGCLEKVKDPLSS